MALGLFRSLFASPSVCIHWFNLSKLNVISMEWEMFASLAAGSKYVLSISPTFGYQCQREFTNDHDKRLALG
jgi:hypothetical protein